MDTKLTCTQKLLPLERERECEVNSWNFNSQKETAIEKGHRKSVKCNKDFLIKVSFVECWGFLSLSCHAAPPPQAQWEI